MTCREKLKLEFPESVNACYAGGCDGCPRDYGYRPDPDYCNGYDDEVCTKCWDREVPDTEAVDKIKSDVANEIINAIAAVTEVEICECTDWYFQCGYHKAMGMILGKLIELKERYGE